MKTFFSMIGAPLVLAIRLTDDCAQQLWQMISHVCPNLDGVAPEDVFREYVGQVLIDPEVFTAHIDWLVTCAPGATPDDNELDPAAIAIEGLDSLGESELIDLALDLGVLVQVEDLLSASPPSEGWNKDLVRLGERINQVDLTSSDDAERFSVQRDVIEGRVSFLSALQIYETFKRRVDIEADSIHAFGQLPDEDFWARIQELEDNQRKAVSATIDEFRKLDVRFHALLAAVAHSSSDAFDAHRMIFENGDPTALSDKRRAEVWMEHQAIVEALKRKDVDKAAEASRAHLNRARGLWLPELEAWVIKRNIGFFARMLAGKRTFLCVSSFNVVPVEMVPRFRGTIGLAAAEAIGRGAVLIYLRPAETLVDRWVESKGISLLKGISHDEIRNSFKEFFEFVVETLVRNGHGTPDIVSEFVAAHLAQFEVDNDDLFMQTRTNSTIGFYRYDGGKTVMTYREPLDDSDAWFGIVEAPQAKSNEQVFVSTARAALLELPKESLETDAAQAVRTISLQHLRMDGDAEVGLTAGR